MVVAAAAVNMSGLTAGLAADEQHARSQQSAAICPRIRPNGKSAAARDLYLFVSAIEIHERLLMLPRHDECRFHLLRWLEFTSAGTPISESGRTVQASGHHGAKSLPPGQGPSEFAASERAGERARRRRALAMSRRHRTGADSMDLHFAPVSS